MSLFAYIKNNISILELAREYTTLAKAGHYWRGRCPLHNERTASFTISEDKQIFYCFGCTAGGDCITLVAKKENCSPLEAAQLLVEKYQLTVPDTLQTNKQPQDVKKRYFALNELVATWCQQQLVKNKEAQEYLISRGINRDSVRLFRIGYFPGGPDALNQLAVFMRQRSILVDDLLDLHIVIKGKNILYSPFEERIIFPISDHLGRICGFGGRIFKPHDTRAKYYNSRENTYFTKGTLLFGLQQAKMSMQKESMAFLVEGYTDCIAMAQHGYQHTIATLGTACSLEHLTLLSRYAQKLYVLYDGDRAGQEAMLRLTKLCWTVNLELYAITLPDKQDPSSYLLTHGSLNTLVEHADDIFVFFIKRTGSEFSHKPLAQQLMLIHELLTVIVTLDDEIKQNLLLEKAAATLGLPRSSLQQELARMVKPSTQALITQEADGIREPGHELPPLEKKIISSILYDMQLLSTLNDVTQEYLDTCLTEPLITLFRALQAWYAKGVSDFQTFFDSLDDGGRLLVSYLVAQVQEGQSVHEFQHLVEQLKKRNWKVMVNAMKKRVAHATQQGDNGEATRIIQEFLDFKNRYYDSASNKSGDV